MAENQESPKLDKEIQRDLKNLKEKKYDSLIEQIDAEYNIAWSLLNPKLTEWLRRLKLYNNQRREKDAVGDTLLFTIFQTILASLYDDRLMVEFGGREKGDEEVAQNLNDLAEFDHDEMEKDILDYEWDWDAIFFGRGLVSFTTFDRKSKTPLAEVIDPTTFLRDPRASSINGNRLRRNGARFFGREIRMTKNELKSNPAYFNLHRLRLGKEIKSLIQQSSEARREAQNLQQVGKFKEKELKENAEYDLLEWSTFWKGKKVLVTLGNSRKLVIRYQEVNEDKWPIIDRPLYPTAHDWDGTSIPDLVEDKQRHRSVAQNLALDILQADLYPMYIFDKNRIKNRADLNFEFNKFIPVEGDTANVVSPVNKFNADKQLLDYILGTLDTAAQRATATPEIQQGVISQEQRTLGEINLVSSKVDTRYSLSAKIFGWSEKRFWRQWYHLYKKHFKEGIDEKVIRLVGAFGPKWRPLKRENIIANVDPDVKVESKVISDVERVRERSLFTSYVALLLQDPTSNRRYALRKLGKLNGLEKDELERLLPPSVDELQAESENEQLSNDITVPVQPNDDHPVHLEIHAKAADTDATFAHIETHKKAMLIKRDQPELFPQPKEIVEEGTPVPAIGAGQREGTPSQIVEKLVNPPQPELSR